MTWRRFCTLAAGLPADSAWARFIRAYESRPIDDPQEARDVLGQLYPQLNRPKGGDR